MSPVLFAARQSPESVWVWGVTEWMLRVGTPYLYVFLALWLLWESWNSNRPLPAPPPPPLIPPSQPFSCHSWLLFTVCSGRASCGDSWSFLPTVTVLGAAGKAGRVGANPGVSLTCPTGHGLIRQWRGDCSLWWSCSCVDYLLPCDFLISFSGYMCVPVESWPQGHIPDWWVSQC